jgi:acetyl-CoA synthetase
MQSEDPLFILYTSGSTGKPKGVLHTCGGYMVYAGYTFSNVFQYKPGEIHWCTADIGWVTGHSYILYGPLLNGATTLMFEGIPTFPDAGRFWEVVDKHRVNIFYTAPTAIRSLMSAGLDHVLPYSLHSLRVLGSVGEPINEEAWHWYDTNIGKNRCAIVDTFWQTETGGIMLTSCAGVTESKPALAGLPMPMKSKATAWKDTCVSSSHGRLSFAARGAIMSAADRPISRPTPTYISQATAPAEMKTDSTVSSDAWTT